MLIVFLISFISFILQSTSSSPIPTSLNINGLHRPIDLIQSPFDIAKPIILSWSNTNNHPTTASLFSNNTYLLHINNLSTPITIHNNSTFYQFKLQDLQPLTSYKIQLHHINHVNNRSTITFETAPSNFSSAQWIGGGSEVRTTWNIHLTNKVTITKVRAYASGLGAFELQCSGNKMGTSYMDPGQSVYDQKVLYVGFDLTACLATNSTAVISAKIGNGKWGYLDIYTNRTLVNDQSGDSTRSFILYAFAELSNGTRTELVTNANEWSYRHGPIVYDHMWHGEIYDARQETALWISPAIQMNPKIGILVPQNMPPIRITKTYTPVSIRTDSDGSKVYDIGTNAAGFVTLELIETNECIHGKTFKVTMEHSEIESTNGVPYNNYYPGMEFNHSKTCSMKDWYAREWYECANQTDAFIFTTSATTSTHTYQPTFTYHGFRYVRVVVTELLNGDEDSLPLVSYPFNISLLGHRVHSNLKTRATIDLSQPKNAGYTAIATSTLFENIFNVTLQSHVSNIWSIPTDCPQREKRGWMGDAGISSLSLSTLFDTSAFHINFLNRIADNQIKSCVDQPSTSIAGPCVHIDPITKINDALTFYKGSVPDVVPFSTSPYGINPGTVDWQATFITIARNVIVQYGASTFPLISELWQNLVALMDYYERLIDPTTGLLLSGARGDWIPPPDTAIKTGTKPVAAFFHTLCVKHMFEIAKALNKVAEANIYKARYARNVKAYHTYFYNRTTTSCCYETGSQTNNMFALFLNIPPTDDIKSATIQSLVKSIHTHIPPSSKSKAWEPGPHLDMGIFGTTWIFDVLTNNNLTDLAMEILNQTSYPSFGHFIKEDATTLWETWAGSKHVIGPGGTSRNHIMYGGNVNLFILYNVVGLPRLNLMATTLATTFTPSNWAVTHLKRASGRLGEYAIKWERTNDVDLRVEVDVPFGVVAKVNVRGFDVDDTMTIQHGDGSLEWVLRKIQT